MIQFGALHDVLNRATRMAEDEAWVAVIDPDTKKYIISLNTHEQLGDDGIDSLGRSLGEYAPLTVELRSAAGLQVDHIDFKVTGEYWGSWRIDVKRDSFIIHVDEERFNELVNELRFSPDHVGLTDENIGKLISVIRLKLIEYVKKQLSD